MVGLGESKDEIIQVMDDLRSAEVDFITIGQYLQPTTKHHPLDRYYRPDEFEEFETIAKTKGFLLISSSPLKVIRSELSFLSKILPSMHQGTNSGYFSISSTISTS